MTHNPQHIVLFHHFRRLLVAAAEAGLDLAPLKGAHLMTGVYPANEDRGRLSDVDFLVRPEDWDLAGRVLKKIGARSSGQNPSRRRSMEEFHEAIYYLDVDGGGVRTIFFEPHRQLVQPSRHKIDYDSLWSRSLKSTFDGAPCLRLSPEDHFVHGVVHLMTNRFGKAARSLRDLELLITRGGADLDVVVDRARQWECVHALWLTLVFLDRLNPALDARLRLPYVEPPSPIRKALEFLVPEPDGFVLRDKGLRVEQAVLWPWLFDTPAQMTRFSRYYAGVRIRDLLSMLRP